MMNEVLEVVIPRKYIESDGPFQRILEAAFSIDRREYTTGNDLTIICRYSQWTRFTAAVKNPQIKLKRKRILEECSIKILKMCGNSRVDVSGRKRIYAIYDFIQKKEDDE